ncbi:Protein FAR1-RELATED SEQUENCE 4 [Senna tora]|uniref:Protein FAR1-RELATED SEQUENCE 4 n=1 Tax=Senna tora TaxID=362788 RepID=A0A835CDK8_9FABA|nr:Protein FAR1-RELATED SEQUENCE 4 [Senna tora]
MATKKVIAICQSGGEFVTSKDGSLAYKGGEAFAIDIDNQAKLSDLKSEVAEMFNCNTDTMIIKYFLPGNKKTLITIAKDKDLQRMVNFLGDAATIDLFITSGEAAARNTSNVPGSRSSRTAVPDVPVVPPVDVPVDTVHPMNQVQAAEANEAPMPFVPTETNVSMLGKAGQQWENAITGVDQRFRSLSEFKEALHKYSIAHGFAYKYKKNDTHRVTVRCKSEGCPWKIYISRLATTQLLCIKKMIAEHTCEGASVKVKAGYRSTRGWVGNIIKEKLKDSPNYKPRDIAEDIKRDYGVQLNYSQAWRAKEIARELLQGSYKEAYTQLPFFCERIKETNPGSFATLTTKEDSSFHRFFVSFHASISGFQRGCRPLLFLDSTPLNTKYQGELLAATAVDGSDGIFPVAFAVVDAENEDNWHWFLQELKSAISTTQQITFVADFQNGLKRSLAEIFENCYHGYCLRHLAEKLNKDLKGQFSHESRHLIINDFYAAAYATKPDVFAHSIDNIKNISLEAYNWVLQSEPKHWSNAFFGGARYNHLTSNFGQEFYSWVSEVHDMPITQMIDLLRCNLMETIYSRRVAVNQWLTKLVPSKEEMLQKETTVARSLQVLLSQGNTYEVCGESIDHVNVDAWECTCKGWQITGLPCCHAIAVLECTGRSLYDYCSRYFTVENYQLTYAESIRPVTNFDRPLFLGESTSIVTPPSTKRPPGRPKVKPVESESVEITKRQLQCSKCKEQGHNRKTCKLL